MGDNYRQVKTYPPSNFGGGGNDYDCVCLSVLMGEVMDCLWVVLVLTDFYPVGSFTPRGLSAAHVLSFLVYSLFERLFLHYL